ncbi:MAG: PQQ-binding-like beta-propeller repeat protein [Bacteroidota bacterium]
MKKYVLLLSLLLSIHAAAQLKFAHVSDTHVGNSTGAEDLRRTVSDLNSFTDISFVIITGDITESGKDDDVRTAKQILDSLTIPWYIIPGNHDMKWSESGGTSFGKIFGGERFVFDAGKYSFVGVHQGPRMRMGDAYWATEDVRWLDSVLTVLQKRQRKVIIATHYPADSGIANWYRVTQLARKYHVLAFLNGHFHQNLFKIFDDIPSVIGRSNLRGKELSGGYNIVEIRNDSMIYALRITGKETGTPWVIVPLRDTDSSNGILFIDSVQLSHRQKYPDVKVSSIVSNPYSMNAPPAVSADFIAYAFYDGSVFINARNSKKKYSLKTSNPILSTPALEKTKIVISSTDTTISCYDFVKNRVEWRVKTKKAVVAPPIIENGIVYCGASDNTFRAIDLTTGKLLWSYDSLQGHVESRPLIVKERIIIGAWDEHLYCLDKRSGKLLWKWKGGRSGILFSPAACEPVYAHGKVFIVAPDRYMTSIDISTGETIWRTDQFKVRETIGITEDGEHVYVRTMNDSVYAISTRENHPIVLWGTNAGFGYDINSSQIREKFGVVFVTTKNGELIALDATQGTVLWKFKEDNVIAHTPIPLSKNTVMFTNIVGTICTVVYKTK